MATVAAEAGSDDEDAAPIPPHTAQSVARFGDFIKRRLSDIPRESINQALVTESRMWVGFVKRHSDTLSGQFFGAVRNGRFGNVMFQFEQLIQALLLGNLLRDRLKLKKVLKGACKFLLDRDTARSIIIALDRKHAVPSTATLTRHQLCGMVAFLRRYARYIARRSPPIHSEL